MDLQIISRCGWPQGYSLRLGKFVWIAFCIPSLILSAFLSQASSPDYIRLAMWVYLIAAPGWLGALYYFYTFRDTIRWFLLIGLILNTLLLAEMSLRIWFPS